MTETVLRRGQHHIVATCLAATSIHGFLVPLRAQGTAVLPLADSFQSLPVSVLLPPTVSHSWVPGSPRQGLSLMVTGDPLAPTPSGPGDGPRAISGFALVLPLPQPGNCQGPKYRGPTRSQAGPAVASGLGKEEWERGPAQGPHRGRGPWAGHTCQQLARCHHWAQVLKSGLRPFLTLFPSAPLIQPPSSWLALHTRSVPACRPLPIPATLPVAGAPDLTVRGNSFIELREGSAGLTGNNRSLAPRNPPGGGAGQEAETGQRTCTGGQPTLTSPPSSEFPVQIHVQLLGPATQPSSGGAQGPASLRTGVPGLVVVACELGCPKGPRDNRALEPWGRGYRQKARSPGRC